MPTHTLQTGMGLLLLLALSVYSYITLTRTETRSPIHVRWLIAHEPTDLFARAEKVFADDLKKESNGSMDLQVLTLKDFGVTTGVMPSRDIFAHMDAGDIEMSSTFTSALGYSDPDFWTLTLPFLFTDFTDAFAKLDGPIGEALLEGLSTKTSVRGLAFTLSGGFRIIASKNKEIHTPADLVGLKIITTGGPVAEATLRSWGAIPVGVNLETGKATSDEKNSDAIETVYTRISSIADGTDYVHYITETNHSFFLTAIIVSNSFYNSLTPLQQKALTHAARAAAHAEREDSRALAEATRQKLVKGGAVITTLSPRTREDFRRESLPIYDEYQKVLGENLIKEFSSHAK